MLLLALDTSTQAVTVAVHDGVQVLAESTVVGARRHTELLMPTVAEVFRTAGVDRTMLTAVAVGVGPGPFTGLRVGLAAARVLGAALEVPVHGVCSLDVIAYETRAAGGPDGPFLVATDARRREVYWAEYDEVGTRVRGPAVGPAMAISATAGGSALPAAGSGARLYPDAFAAILDPEFPSAAHLAAAVVEGVVEIGKPDPLYLRRPDAQPPAARKSVLT